MDQLEAATVIEGDGSATVAEAAKKPKARSAPKWETEARDHLQQDKIAEVPALAALAARR
jgi:hypothetical protein